MADGPRRIQRRRTKGWRMPEGAVYVGRPTRWGNMFGTTACDTVTVGTAREAVECFRKVVTAEKWDLRALRGKPLACWCPLDQPCHADVLLELANA
jgi:hypothetical protein